MIFHEKMSKIHVFSFLQKLRHFLAKFQCGFRIPSIFPWFLVHTMKKTREIGGVFWDISLSTWWVNFGHPLQNTLYQPYGWSYHSTPCTGGKPISTAFRNGAKLFPTPNGLRVRSNFVKEINFCKSLIFTPNLTPGREYWLWTAPKRYKSHKNLISRPPTYR